MSKITVEYQPGKTHEAVYYDGLCFPLDVLKLMPNGFPAHVQGVKQLEIRDDDVYLATYPKSGTHWVWEILMMLRKGSSNYEVNTKEFAFLDFRPANIIQDIPSPRVLNCHYPAKLIPEGILTKGIKIIHVQRNPKDVAVSAFHHMKNHVSGCETFSDYLPFFLGSYGITDPMCPWYSYVKEWERFTKKHQDQILNLYYEDLKEDPVREIKKMDKFLGTGRDDNLISAIADACHFHNMKKADNEVKDKSFMKPDEGRPPTNMYRKGEVGDWKNHFTVSQNEQMDCWLRDNLVDTALDFRYTL